MNIVVKAQTGTEIRALARTQEFAGQTAGQAPDHLQGNVVILPASEATDFLQFCRNNPKPCPLIGLSKPGEPFLPALGEGLDIRTDVPKYRIFKSGELVEETTDISQHWTNELVTFVLGCSFTFEEALMKAGFTVRHIENGSNVPMFKTSIETIPGGIFRGPMVVTMRPYKQSEIPAVFDLCTNYSHAHGTPIYWGDPARIGIKDLNAPDYGDPVKVLPGEVPVFWACGVTPQAAIEAAKPGFCITHAPGHMLVTDIHSHEKPDITVGMKDFNT